MHLFCWGTAGPQQPVAPHCAEPSGCFTGQQTTRTHRFSPARCFGFARRRCGRSASSHPMRTCSPWRRDRPMEHLLMPSSDLSGYVPKDRDSWFHHCPERSPGAGIRHARVKTTSLSRRRTSQIEADAGNCLTVRRFARQTWADASTSCCTLLIRSQLTRALGSSRARCPRAPHQP